MYEYLGCLSKSQLQTAGFGSETRPKANSIPALVLSHVAITALTLTLFGSSSKKHKVTGHFFIVTSHESRIMAKHAKRLWEK